MPAGEYQQSHSDVNADSYPSKGDTSIVMEFGPSVAKCFNIFKESQTSCESYQCKDVGNQLNQI